MIAKPVYLTILALIGLPLVASTVENKELANYQKYVHELVGARWNSDMNRDGIYAHPGMVHIQFTVHSNGTVTDVIFLKGNERGLLATLSKYALINSSPFKPFSEALVKEVGTSYTDDYTFTVSEGPSNLSSTKSTDSSAQSHETGHRIPLPPPD